MNIDWGQIINGSVTLVVGATAFVVYFLKKRDDRKNAASIIVSDLRRASKLIEELQKKKEINIESENVPLIIVDSWNNYKHLFIKKLDVDEFNEIDGYFGSCKTFDIFLSKNNVFVSLEQKSRVVMEVVGQYAMKAAEGLDGTPVALQRANEYFAKARNDFELIYGPDNTRFVGGDIRITLEKKLNELFTKQILSSVAFAKLKKLAKMK
ncbi:MAG: hypothetical protein UT32_C0005G0011 [Parcubacteria group bacterium GW2011_GWC2_39_14]|nr:MAG: hypothetical protein UT32_C0005G0011 [Parcubacteria group bacterium GW2011_GWC2_39_14]KKR54592.1 MAG: hypothetical protein UT91_C0012G0011 [Parcubacteria group bacterium GW2011_GWA2_40_23]